MPSFLRWFWQIPTIKNVKNLVIYHELSFYCVEVVSVVAV